MLYTTIVVLYFLSMLFGTLLCLKIDGQDVKLEKNGLLLLHIQGRAQNESVYGSVVIPSQFYLVRAKVPAISATSSFHVNNW